MSPSDVPVLSVVAGSPTDNELAAIVAVLTAAAAAPEPAYGRDEPLTGGWKCYTRTLHRAQSPGPGAWRRSYR
jgi:hypothetical protein